MALDISKKAYRQFIAGDEISMNPIYIKNKTKL